MPLLPPPPPPPPLLLPLQWGSQGPTAKQQAELTTEAKEAWELRKRVLADREKQKRRHMLQVAEANMAKMGAPPPPPPPPPPSSSSSGNVSLARVTTHAGACENTCVRDSFRAHSRAAVPSARCTQGTTAVVTKGVKALRALRQQQQQQPDPATHEHADDVNGGGGGDDAVPRSQCVMLRAYYPP